MGVLIKGQVMYYIHILKILHNIPNKYNRLEYFIL